MRNIDDLFPSTTFIENSLDIFVVLKATCTHRVARMKNPLEIMFSMVKGCIVPPILRAP